MPVRYRPISDLYQQRSALQVGAISPRTLRLALSIHYVDNTPPHLSRRRADLREREHQRLALLPDAVELLSQKPLFLELQLALVLDLTQLLCQLRRMQAVEIQADPNRCEFQDGLLVGPVALRFRFSA